MICAGSNIHLLLEGGARQAAAPSASITEVTAEEEAGAGSAEECASAETIPLAARTKEGLADLVKVLKGLPGALWGFSRQAVGYVPLQCPALWRPHVMCTGCAWHRHCHDTHPGKLRAPCCPCGCLRHVMVTLDKSECARVLACMVHRKGF